ncbi:FAD-binding oxidoreductase [Sulfobacillus thermosulfidooxidans]|uniref:FAD-binding oxidoreductase n=1 Tax=Sulfobacillus thermosulfidooxidans TaxID=28034 RepID=UPI001111E89F|nr:FAD-binding oxidoreductase [Sulfobacillus thermosulfidooxidans]
MTSSISAEQKSKIMQALLPIVGQDALIAQSDALTSYRYDATGQAGHPDLVVLPSSTSALRQVLKILESFSSLPIIVRGSGTNLCGGTVPKTGGVVIALTRLQSWLYHDLRNRYIVVESGLLTASVNHRLNPLGYHYGPDPGSYHISTIGGNVAENAGGIHGVSYGVTTQHVLQMHIYIGNKGLLTPTIHDFRTTLDITGLLVGSEGTLAIVDTVILNILPQWPHIATMLIIFSTLPEAVDTALGVLAAAVSVSALELMDEASLKVIQPLMKDMDFGKAQAALLIDIHSSPARLFQESMYLKEITKKYGALKVLLAETATESRSWWEGRRAQYGAAARLAPRLWVQDVAVPLSQLKSLFRRIEEIQSSYAMPIITVAHAGDGNLHPDIPYDPTSATEVSRAHAMVDAILQEAVALGGTISGEHGIGHDKLPYLGLMYGDEEQHVFAAIKQCFDPDWRLNPGIAVYRTALKDLQYPLISSPTSSISQKSSSLWQPGNLNELQEMIYTASRSHLTLTVQGAGHWQNILQCEDTRMIQPISLCAFSSIHELDPESLSITVGAGIPNAELTDFLASYHLQHALVSGHPQGTTGGLVSRNNRSWHHSYQFGWRDTLLAISVIDGQGRHLKFGSKAIKDVAGYDVKKLFIGSWGALGIITSLTFKLETIPKTLLWGTFRAKTLQQLLNIAIDLGSHAYRPEAIFIKRWSFTDPELVIRILGPHCPEMRRLAEQLALSYQADLTWQQSEFQDDLDIQRENNIRNAWQQHGYCYEGGVWPTDLLNLIPVIGDRLFTLFPVSGAYEIYGQLPFSRVLPGLHRVWHPNNHWSLTYPTWHPYVQGLKEIFDPKQIFAVPWTVSL